MVNSKYVTAGFSALGMLLLIIDGKTAIAGASEGLELCIRAVIPSLFPFFLLSGVLTGSLLGSDLTFLRPMGRIFRIPEGAESLLLTGFLGGYPVGAQNITQAWRSGQLSEEDSERMIAFCNNAGPSFLFGIIGPMFSEAKYPWMLWFIQILSAIIVSSCLHTEGRQLKLPSQSSVSIFLAMKKALYVTATVCGWVILFRIIIRFLDRWILWILPNEWKITVMGILELTNGCCSLSAIPDEGLRFLLCAGMLGFGGICVTMQTASVTNGLRLKWYFPGKLMQAALSIFYAGILVPTDACSPYFLPMMGVIAVICGLYIRKKQNNSSIPQLLGV